MSELAQYVCIIHKACVCPILFSDIGYCILIYVYPVIWYKCEMDNAKRVCYNIDLDNMIISLHGSDMKGYPFKRNSRLMHVSYEY
jgi:hypothetical protein